MATAVMSTRENPVFKSKSDNHRWVRFPAQTRVENGMVQNLSPGLAYDFEDGTLVVDEELRVRDARYIAQYGKWCSPETLDDGAAYLSTEAALRRRADETGGFVEMPVAVPDSAPVFEEITGLVIDRDLAGLVRLAEDERDGWQREDVLDMIDRALTGLQEG